MIILVNAQRISQRRPAIKPVPMEIDGSPGTVADLIMLCVKACVTRQHRRIANEGEAVFSQSQLDDLAAVGRIAFDVNNNGTFADEDEALANALQSYEDGLYRIFLNGSALGGLSDPVSLSEQDQLTFVRLVMLAGGGW